MRKHNGGKVEVGVFVLVREKYKTKKPKKQEIGDIKLVELSRHDV